MKQYKPIDFFLQLFLLIVTVATFFIPGTEGLFIYGIFAFAIVQVISLIAHAVTGKTDWKKSSLRKYHLIGTALVLASLVAALVTDSAEHNGDKEDKYQMTGLGIMIWVTIPAILLGLFYMVITWLEWKRIKQRELIHLK
jgi:hypothetical protein